MQEARIYCKWGPYLYQENRNSCAAFFSSLHLLLSIFIFISVFGSQSVGIINNFWSGYPIPAYQARDDPLKLIYRPTRKQHYTIGRSKRQVSKSFSNIRTRNHYHTVFVSFIALFQGSQLSTPICRDHFYSIQSKDLICP